jgi:peroxiredoxin
MGKSIAYYVENSPDSKRIKELTDRQHLILKQINQLTREWEKARGDTLVRRTIDSTYHALLRDQREYTLDFIHDKPKSLANILALYQNFGRKSQELFDLYDDFKVFNFVDSNLVPLYPNTAAVKALNRDVNETRQQIAHRRYIKKIVKEGRLLPDFSYPALSGDTISVTPPTGKPVLLFFWASWNPFSVDELLALNDFYLQAKPVKIAIITISLDSSEKHLSAFLDEHPVQLPVVCDYDYWDSEIAGRYAVKQIPSSLLCNKEGVIVAKDIFSDELLNRITHSIQ